MLLNYKHEEFPTVMTFEQWEKLHNELQAEKMYFIKQKVCGILLFVLGVIAPLLLVGMEGNLMFSVVCIPLGLWATFTKNKIMNFKDGSNIK